MRAKLETIEGAWKRFREMVIHPEAPPEQLDEMQKAFYGGIKWMLGQMEYMGEPQVSEESGILHLELLKEEIEAYRRSAAGD